jgi:hypothetical protein
VAARGSRRSLFAHKNDRAGIRQVAAYGAACRHRKGSETQHHTRRTASRAAPDRRLLRAHTSSVARNRGRRCREGPAWHGARAVARRAWRAASVSTWSTVLRRSTPVVPKLAHRIGGGKAANVSLVGAARQRDISALAPPTG